MNKTELHTRINEAVSAFWETKQKQLSSSGDNSNRGAVTAGKQLDGFIALLKDIAIQHEASTSPVKNYEPFFPVRPEFNSASYLDRYRNLCQKLVLERHYSAAALVCTEGPGHYAKMSDDTSIEVFINSFRGYLTGIADEF